MNDDPRSPDQWTSRSPTAPEAGHIDQAIPVATPRPGVWVLDVGSEGADLANRLCPVAHAALADRPRMVVLDLSVLTAPDADVVAALVNLAYHAGAADIGLCLLAGCVVGRALAEAGVLDLFEIHRDLRDALRTLNR